MTTITGTEGQWEVALQRVWMALGKSLPEVPSTQNQIRLIWVSVLPALADSRDHFFTAFTAESSLKKDGSKPMVSMSRKGSASFS